MSFNLGQLVTALSLVPQLGQLVTNTVHEVENIAANVPGMSGNQKLQAVTAKVESLVSAAVQDAGAISAISGVLGPLINSTVAMFNAANLFTHKSDVK